MASIKDNVLELDGVIIKLNKNLDDNINKLNAGAAAVDAYNKKLSAVPSQFQKSLVEIKDSTDDVRKANEKLINTEKEKYKLEQKLVELNKDSAKEIQKIKVQIQEKNKELRNEAKEELGLLNAYDLKSKRLNELRSQYKNLIVQEGKATKETKELKKEIQALDRELKDVDADVGQFQRNVGNYASAFKKAGGVVKGAFAGGLIGGAIGSATSKASEFFSLSKEAGDNAKTNLAPVLATLQVLLASLVDIIPVLIKDFKVFFKEIQLGIAQLPDILGGSAEKANELKKEIALLNSTFKGKSYSEAFADFGKRIEDTTEQIKENVKANRDAELRILSLSRTIAKLSAEEEALRVIADDNNKSFQERSEAFEKARVIADKRAKAEIEQAKQTVILTENLIKLQLKQAGVNTDLTNILGDKSRATKVDEQTLVAYVEALNGVTQAEGLRNQQIKQDSKEAADIQRDLFEQNLDYALDYTDNQKSINERLIADDSLTLETRKKILAQTNAIFQKALEQQVALFEEQTGKKININDLLNAEDSGTLLESVRALKMGEIETQRLLEVIRDYKTGVQDLSEAQKELNLSSQQTIDLQTEIALQTKFLNGEIKTQEELDNELTKSLIKNMQDRLSTMNEGSIEYLETIKAINDALISLDENAKKSGDRFKSYFQGFVDEFGNNSGFSKIFDILSDKIEGFGENAKVTALAISEAFQQAFNTIAEFSQANFDAEYSRLEQQKNYAIQFAGESTTAKEEIERQYNERKKKIQRREAQAQKQLAIFNAVIDTAQAVVAALPNYALAAVVGVLGAAQIALISSQPIPEFWRGTDNAPEGLAWTQERGAEVITDKKGNIKTLGSDKGAQLTYLSKGDKVYKSHEDYINKQLSKNGIQELGSYLNISPKVINEGITKEDLQENFSKLANVIKKKDNITINVDKRGVTPIVNGNTILNSRLTIKSRQV